MNRLSELLNKVNLTSSDVAELIEILANTAYSDSETIQLLFANKTIIAKIGQSDPDALNSYQQFLNRHILENAQFDNIVNLILTKLNISAVYRDSGTDGSEVRIISVKPVIREVINRLNNRLKNEVSYRTYYLNNVNNQDERLKINFALDDEFSAIRKEISANELLLQFFQTQADKIKTLPSTPVPRSSIEVPLQQAPPAPSPTPAPELETGPPQFGPPPVGPQINVRTPNLEDKRILTPPGPVGVRQNIVTSEINPVEDKVSPDQPAPSPPAQSIPAPTPPPPPAAAKKAPTPVTTQTRNTVSTSRTATSARSVPSAAPAKPAAGNLTRQQYDAAVANLARINQDLAAAQNQLNTLYRSRNPRNAAQIKALGTTIARLKSQAASAKQTVDRLKKSI